MSNNSPFQRRLANVNNEFLNEMNKLDDGTISKATLEFGEMIIACTFASMYPLFVPLVCFSLITGLDFFFT